MLVFSDRHALLYSSHKSTQAEDFQNFIWSKNRIKHGQIYNF